MVAGDLARRDRNERALVHTLLARQLDDVAPDVSLEIELGASGAGEGAEIANVLLPRVPLVGAPVQRESLRAGVEAGLSRANDRWFCSAARIAEKGHLVEIHGKGDRHGGLDYRAADQLPSIESRP
jgi:hypothetical protein